ncbi:Tripartite tricarboxylate transporter family receptor [Pigmentiphaga humi]|uniref:Tripartite tricarboxylate transporter family receptor n=1 Tax=Pigmentiphaga humi TaxID=2478468 RepID=A0A3P4AYP7_9BURK|nr:tripartite tricarboxylate transporter substrate binding protein [Pigmentiphaga humi]VCU68570.1 Tripartite tricarboxylate transporter family receptor [Pigmentiphaga humi]
MLRFTGPALAAAALTLAPAAHAAYPDRPVVLVVPSVPGGAADLVGRMLAEQLGKRWNQPVIVENRPGGAFIIGTQTVIKAAPDGYTLLLGADASFSAVPYLMDKMPYQPDQDLLPVSPLSTLRYVLVASPASPYRSVEQLLAQARAHPGTVTFASGGEGSTHHLGMELFSHASGASFKHVPYKAAPQGFVDVMGGHVDMMFIAASTAIQPVKTGKVQGLANTADTPIPDLPGLPMLKDKVQGFTFDSWFGLFAPAGTPAAVASRLNASVQAVLKDPQVRDKLQAQGLSAWEGDGQTLRERIAADTQRLLPVIAKLKEQGRPQP